MVLDFCSFKEKKEHEKKLEQENQEERKKQEQKWGSILHKIENLMKELPPTHLQILKEDIDMIIR